METADLFRSFIIDPLERVIGKPLVGVSYYILEFEVEDFLLDNPNLTGLASVLLYFGDVTLVVAPFWRAPLRLSNSYHIEIVSPSEYHVNNDPLPGAISMVQVAANESKLWKGATGTVLLSVYVFGIRESPQAIRLEFPTASVLISIGSSTTEPILGDADEILLVSGSEWGKLPKLFPDEWSVQWSS